MFTKSKMAPVNISQNDYLALSLCVLCITILRRRIRHRTRVGKKQTRYWFSYLYLNILLILYSILLIWPQPFQSILLSRHLSTLFKFWKPSCKFSFSAIFTMCFLFGKQNCIIPKLNSDWLIPIKVHPSFKKNRMAHISTINIQFRVFLSSTKHVSSYNDWLIDWLFVV